MYRKMMILNKTVWNKFELLDALCKEVDAKVAKLEGMSKFTYAWCKSAQEANVFKLKQKY